jgi:hypothetical protein
VKKASEIKRLYELTTCHVDNIHYDRVFDLNSRKPVD